MLLLWRLHELSLGLCAVYLRCVAARWRIPWGCVGEGDADDHFLWPSERWFESSTYVDIGDVPCFLCPSASSCKGRCLLAGHDACQRCLQGLVLCSILFNNCYTPSFLVF